VWVLKLFYIGHTHYVGANWNFSKIPLIFAPAAYPRKFFYVEFAVCYFWIVQPQEKTLRQSQMNFTVTSRADPLVQKCK